MNKNIYLYGLLFAIIMSSIFSQAKASDTRLNDWNSLELILSSHEFHNYGVEDFLDIDEIRIIHSRNDECIYWEMIGQDSYPFVQLAGFQMLASQNPNAAFDAAIYIVMSSKIPLILAAPAYELLRSDAMSNRMVSQISLIAHEYPNNVEKWSILIESLSSIQNSQWITQHGDDSIPTTYQAIIVDEVLSNDKNPSKATARAMALIQKYRFFNGIPLSVYVSHASDSDAGFQNAIQSVLEDPKLPDLIKMIVAHKRQSYIIHNLNWRALHTSQQVLRFLAQSSPPITP